jgi:hypothetical protein
MEKEQNFPSWYIIKKQLPELLWQFCTAFGHKLRFPPSEKAQFVTVGIILSREHRHTSSF